MGGATEFELTAADGWRLHGQCWLPKQPGAVLVVVHGIAEHGGRKKAAGHDQCGEIR